MNRIIDIRKTDTGSEPLTLTEVKTHLHITDSDNDTELTALITQCRKVVEAYCSISIVNKDVIMIADLDREWELPWGPVTGIAGVQTGSRGTGSAPVTYETEEEGWIVDGMDFLTFTSAFYTRYKLYYTTGFSSVPADLKLAILNEILFRYENRGDTGDKICKEAEELALPYKRLSWM